MSSTRPRQYPNVQCWGKIVCKNFWYAEWFHPSVAFLLDKSLKLEESDIHGAQKHANFMYGIKKLLKHSLCIADTTTLEL